MTDDRSPLAELIQKSGDGDFLRSVAEAVLQMLMEADVEGVIGAGRHERSAERLTWRNGPTAPFSEAVLNKSCDSAGVLGRWNDSAIVRSLIKTTLNATGQLAT